MVINSTDYLPSTGEDSLWVVIDPCFLFSLLGDQRAKFKRDCFLIYQGNKQLHYWKESCHFLVQSNLGNLPYIGFLQITSRSWQRTNTCCVYMPEHGHMEPLGAFVKLDASRRTMKDLFMSLQKQFHRIRLCNHPITSALTFQENHHLFCSSVVFYTFET